MVTDHRNILLDEQVNEMEIVEFSIKDALYGINVSKVREIINADIDLLPVPDMHLSIEGAINLRGSIIPVINLAPHLDVDAPLNRKKNRIIVAEFNGVVVGFLVGAVARIHRVSGNAVETPSQMFTGGENYTAGIIRIDEKVIFILDFEKIICHINPHVHIRPSDEGSRELINGQGSLKPEGIC